MTQSESIHGHEVLHFMLENSDGFTRDELIAAINARFGKATRFHTCSAQGMDAMTLVDFLAAKGKFVEKAGGGFNTLPENICNH